MKRLLSAMSAALVAIGVSAGCGSILGLDGLKNFSDGGSSDGRGTDPNPDAEGAVTASKVDLLIVVDDSTTMAAKATLLASSIGTLLRKVTSLAPDVHVGVITTSLGTMGGDVCVANASQNRLAHLSTLGIGGGTVGGAEDGVLRYGGGGPSDIDALVSATQSLVRGVGQSGCGFEAQLESAYRFLVQPDPWAHVIVNGDIADYQGIDDDLLAQRKAFLRPDSLVVVLLLTDKEDRSADPRSLGGLGWAFENNTFPGSTSRRPDNQTTTAPRGTSVCEKTPASRDCVSCACKTADPACSASRTDPQCQNNGGYYGTTGDQLNVRFFNMKQRFGVDPQFPITRYSDGFTKSKVSDRNGEHAVIDGAVSEYLAKPSCTNPLFAASLPDPKGELCNLAKGPRGKELVLFAVIGGVPAGLVSNDADIDWMKVVGKDPAAFDLDGIDLHMVESTSMRGDLAKPSTLRGDNGNDPVHGREWTTDGDDLQFACTFGLSAPRKCTLAELDCECAQITKNPPLCGAVSGEQIRDRAYPTIRPLRVVKALGSRGIAGSICPSSNADGYTTTMNVLAERINSRMRGSN